MIEPIYLITGVTGATDGAAARELRKQGRRVCAGSSTMTTREWRRLARWASRQSSAISSISTRFAARWKAFIRSTSRCRTSSLPNLLR